MRLDGDIKVWTDGEKACARLTADGPEGPIVLHASAPLGPIRQQVERAFARRGASVSGADPAYKAAVRRLGRTRALKRLKRMAPAAFQPGGLASHLASKKLAARRRVRGWLARAGRPIGAKPIAALRSRLPRGLAAVLPGGASMAPAPGPAARPTPGAPGGGAGPSAASQAANLPTDPPEEAESTDEPAPPPAHDGGTDVDAADGGDEDMQEGAEEGQDEQEEVGMDPRNLMVQRLRRQRRARRRMRAALRLLAAAQREPRARQHVRHIVSMAGEGNPKAQKALKALAAAKKVKTAAAGKGKALVPVKPRPAPVRALVPPRPPVPRGRPIAEAPARMRWWDIFAPWRGGIG